MNINELTDYKFIKEISYCRRDFQLSNATSKIVMHNTSWFIIILALSQDWLISDEIKVSSKN